MHTTTEITPAQVAPTLKKHILKDGFDLVQDLERSHGSFLHDSLHNRELLDFFTSFATIPLGYNHPKMRSDEGFRHRLFEAALANPANSDIYTTEMARFMATFSRVGIPTWLPRAFFVAGGALAVENAVKTAMDWKVQKNFAKGYTYEKGHKVLHFQEAFHGRSGYTLSLTNTDPAKTKWFAKFADWPRVLNPKMVFPYTDENHEDLLRREALSLAQIKMAFHEHRDDICCIIIEPIQGEGGDNHFRPEFMEQLRLLCDENEALLIYDEVQMGMGCTGTFWCHEHFGPNARPDIISFGKKMQVCGILAGPKVDEVETNVFRVSSRINSTWGGNLVDMVRVDRIMEIMEEDNVLENVRTTGAYFQSKLHEISQEKPGVTNVRGRGLICAFDLPSRATRDEFIRRGREHNVLFLGCAERSIRFRPTLTITPAEIDLGIQAIRTVLTELGV
jgi:L-lysine 6-transaminase